MSDSSMTRFEAGRVRIQRRWRPFYARGLLVSAMAWVGVGGANGAPPEQTVAERLGRAPDARLVIVHADDLAWLHSVNAAFFEAHATGLVNSGSVMVPPPWFPEIVEWAKSHPEADLGLHLTLTCARTVYRWGPVASKNRVPTLLDPDGYFHKNPVEAAQRIDPDQAEIEVRAQIEKALAAGLRPTHLDSHQGLLFRTEGLFRVFLRVTRDYDLPMRMSQGTLADFSHIAPLLEPDAVVFNRAVGNGPEVPAEKWADTYADKISKIGPGVTEVVIHAAYDDAEMRAATADRETWGAAWRQRDFDFFTSARFRRLLAEEGLELVTWREIAGLTAPASR